MYTDILLKPKTGAHFIYKNDFSQILYRMADGF